MPAFEFVEQLETELLEKEQLIAALTTSLEQAANELDRAHRHSLRSSLISESLESHEAGSQELIAQELHDQHLMLREVRDSLRHLNAAQSEQSLQRIENQLHDLRDLIENIATAPPTLPTDWKDSLTQQMSVLRNHPLAELLGLQSEQPQISICDSSLKIDDNSGPERSSVENSTQTTDAKTDPPSSLSLPNESPPEVVPTPQQIQLIDSLPELPAPVDIENSDLESLRTAIAERDECLQAMQDYIAALNTVTVPEFDLKDYDSLPELQRQKLENWEAVIRESMRRTEVELSVERARIGREQQKLQFQQLQLAKERKRMGLQQQYAVGDHPEDSRKTTRPAPGSRTWLSLFHRQEPTQEDPSHQDDT